MRVCFLEDTLLHGGTQIWVTEAAAWFAAHGVDVTLLAPEGSWVVEQFPEIDVRIHTYPWEAPAGSREEWIAALADADVTVCTVHPPRDDFHCMVFVAACIQQAGLQTHLIAKTGTIVPSYRGEYYLPDERINSSVITIAGHTREYLMTAYGLPEEKITLIYQGVDLNRFSLDDQSMHRPAGLPDLPETAGPILGCIGTFEERKGQAVLLESAAELIGGVFPDLQLLLVGDGPDEAALRQQAVDLGITQHVHLVPFTPHPEHIYPWLDLTVLPSLNKEGLPNVLLESLAMGVPVVSSDIGAVKEIVLESRTGKLVPIGDSAALAAAIEILWQDQDLYTVMHEYSPGFIRQNFDKEKQFAQFLAHFNKVKSKL